MTETKCKGQAESLGFMAEDVQSLIKLAEQVCEDMKDEAVWGKPDDPEQLNNEIREVEITISALKSCLAAINNSRLTEQSVSRLRFEKEGFASCSACPCHRAVAVTPPEENAA